MVARLKDHRDFQCIGILLQEAHAADVWPIGFPETLTPNATYTLTDRSKNLERMLEAIPDWRGFQWYMDIPEADPNHHVAGSFNSTFWCWPHRYLILESASSPPTLLFRTDFHYRSARNLFIDFADLQEKVEELLLGK